MPRQAGEDARPKGYAQIHEDDFIAGIGMWNEPPLASRLILLRKYRKALDQRVNWGKLNQNTVKGAVDAAIADIESLPGNRRKEGQQ